MTSSASSTLIPSSFALVGRSWMGRLGIVRSCQNVSFEIMTLIHVVLTSFVFGIFRLMSKTTSPVVYQTRYSDLLVTAAVILRNLFGVAYPIALEADEVGIAIAPPLFLLSFRWRASRKSSCIICFWRPRFYTHFYWGFTVLSSEVWGCFSTKDLPNQISI